MPGSFRQRVVFSLLAVVLFWGGVELLAFLCLSISSQSIFSCQRQRDLLLQPEQLEAQSSQLVVHPYFGFVVRPPSVVRHDPSPTSMDRGSWASGKLRRDPVSAFGFPYTDQSPVQKRDRSRALIGIVGGSVAANFFDVGREQFGRDLKQAGVWRDREMVFINLAMGGYKQPQQTLIVNYLMTLGAQFDLIINIDGFNEVALHEAENAHKQVFPTFPRSWYTYASSLPDAELRALIGKAAYWRERRTHLAATFSLPVLRHSPTANFLWAVLDGTRADEADRVAQEFRRREPRTDEYAVTGPRERFDSDETLYGFLVQVWRRSSLQLQQICQANDIRYYHVLQPNQYVRGSKPMSAAESRIAFVEGHPYRAGTEKGYPRLRMAGRDLLAKGVRFLDLTEVFADHPEPLYIDPCCHFNEVGNAIMGRQIVRAIAKDLTGKE